MASRVWGSEVHAGSFGGHDGLTYYEGLTTRRPVDVRRPARGDRCGPTATFLVHGDRRISFTGVPGAASATRAASSDLARHPLRRPSHGVRLQQPRMDRGAVGTWLAGAVPVLANRWWSAAEIDHAVDVLEPVHVLTDTALDVDVPSESPAPDLRTAFDARPAEAGPHRSPTATPRHWSCSPRELGNAEGRRAVAPFGDRQPAQHPCPQRATPPPARRRLAAGREPRHDADVPRRRPVEPAHPLPHRRQDRHHRGPVRRAAGPRG